jgi:hypothetical protein
MGVVDEAIEDRVGIGGVADKAVPVSHGDLTGDNGGAAAANQAPRSIDVSAASTCILYHRASTNGCNLMEAVTSASTQDRKVRSSQQCVTCNPDQPAGRGPRPGGSEAQRQTQASSRLQPSPRQGPTPSRLPAGARLGDRGGDSGERSLLCVRAR